MSFSISIHPVVSKPLTRILKQRQHNSPRQHVLIDSYLTEPAWGKRSEHESTVVDGAMCVRTMCMCLSLQTSLSITCAARRTIAGRLALVWSSAKALPRPFR